MAPAAVSITPENDLPEWLKELRGEQDQPAESPVVPKEELPTASQHPNVSSSAEVPDWLARIRERTQTQESQGESTGDSLPDWLQSDQSPTETAPKDEMDGWLDNLRTITPGEESSPGDQLPNQPAKPDETQGIEELPAWLSELGSSDQATKTAGAEQASAGLPQHAAEIKPEKEVQLPGEQPAPAPEPVLPPEMALPDWLSDLTGEPTSVTAAQQVPSPAQPEAELPAESPINEASSIGPVPADEAAAVGPAIPAEPVTLPVESKKRVRTGRTGLLARLDEVSAPEAPAVQPQATPQPEPETPQAEPVRPSWLSGLGEIPAAEEPAAQPEAEASAAANLPDWITNLGAATPSSDSTAQAPEPLEPLAVQPEGEPAPVFDTALPGWLADLEETPSTEPTTPAVSESEPFAAQPQPEAAEQAESKLPDWLLGLEETPAGKEGVPHEPVPTEAVPVMSEAEPIPPVEEAVPEQLTVVEGMLQEPVPTEVVPVISEAEPIPPIEDVFPEQLIAVEGLLVDQIAAVEAAPQPDAVVEEPTTPAEPAAQEPPFLTSPAVPAAEEGLPSWLTGLTEEVAEPAAAQPSPFTETPAIPPAAPAETPPEGEGLEWLFGGAEPAAAESDLTAAAPSEVPDWLTPVESGAQPAEAESAEIPDWLKAMQPAQAASVEPESPPLAEEGAIPEWLASAQAQQSAAGLESVPLLPESTESGEPGQVKPFISEELPDWLSHIDNTVPETQASEQAAEVSEKKEEEAGLAPAELPGWVQAMRPIETATPVPVEAEEQQEKTGPLSGLRGILPAQAYPAEIRKPPIYLSKLQVTDKQRINVALFDSLLSTEAQAQVVAKESPRLGRNLLNVAVAILLIVAVWVPMWLGGQQMNLPVYTQPEAVALQADIDALPADAAVLVAVDYEPSNVGEMEAVSTGVIAHLMSRSVNLVVISTNPAGQVLVNQLLEHTLANNSGLSYLITEKVVNLGYLAGGTSALYNFAQYPQLAAPVTADLKNAWEQPVLKDLSNGSNPLYGLSQIIVITADADTARAWIEQVKPTLANVPLYVLSSAQTAPMIGPYVDSGQVKGAVFGITGGSLYESNSQFSSIGRSYWDSYQVGILLMVALILIGGLVNLVDALFVGRKRQKGI
jgi:hypothetical protein